ncbi:MAG TPA: hypothetical protein VGV09_16080 [Steroidobacteraceae bacterium]|nr:hypothetical protein [Steroidobacteraceae bacterium]
MKVLFVPVSAARGFGEYARAREIAVAVQRRWPDAQLHFALSSQASYATQCPFPTTLLPGSATLHTPQVVALLAEFRPDIVIFDNAGRSAQIRAAYAGGARVVYISSRRRQRARAFRLRWMRRLSEHWIAYPRFIAGDLGWLERLKLRIAGRPLVRFVDTVLPVAVASAGAQSADLQDFVLVVPGGGTAHPGAGQAPAIISAAATSLAARGLRTVLVGVAEAADTALLRCLPLLPQAQLVELMRGARLVVSNGGDTLLQALACGCACVAVPIAHDQAARIARCRERQLLRAAPLEAGAIVEAAANLYADDAGRRQLMARVHAAGIADAMPQILEALAALGVPGSR